MIRSDRLFFGVMFGAMILIPIFIIIEMKYEVKILFYLQFHWVLLLPFVFIKMWFPNSKAYKWFISVPKRVIYFYKSTYDKIKLY